MQRNQFNCRSFVTGESPNANAVQLVRSPRSVCSSRSHRNLQIQRSEVRSGSSHSPFKIRSPKLRESFCRFANSQQKFTGCNLQSVRSSFVHYVKESPAPALLRARAGLAWIFAPFQDSNPKFAPAANGKSKSPANFHLQGLKNTW